MVNIQNTTIFEPVILKGKYTSSKHLLRHHEGHPALFAEGVVPGDGGPGVGLLVAVHYHHHWQGEGPHLGGKGDCQLINPLRPDRTNSSCIAKISILK